MDEIEYKLESGNPVLVSHAVSKLFETIRKNVIEQGANLSKLPEFKLLLSKRDCSDSILSLSVSQALVALVEDELWDMGAALATFVSSVSLKNNNIARAMAIGQLILYDLKQSVEKQSLHTFKLHAPQHPFIGILIQDKDSWQAVLNQIKFIMNYQDHRIRKQCIEILRPVFLHILCNPSAELSNSCKRHAWHLLIKTENTLELQIEILLWSCTNQQSSCLDTNDRLLELSEVALFENNKKRCTVLLPVLASLMVQLIKHGSDPKSNLDAISLLLERSDDSVGSITLLLMAEAIIVSPAVYLYNIFQICTMIIRKMPCSNLSLNVLNASILNWMAYPSILCSNALDLARNLVNNISKSSSTSTKGKRLIINDDLLSAFCLSDSYLRFYVEITSYLDIWTESELLSWLIEISLVTINLRERAKLILSGLLVQSNSPEITRLTCNILVEIAREIKSIGSHVLSLVLHKLTKSTNSLESKSLLLAIPQLIMTKENVHIITHTLETLLNAEEPLKYFVIELYLTALSKEPRIYRFLSAAIIRTMKNDHSWYADATCARAMKYICENHSEHGENLVPLLSEILSRCVDTNGGTASALALKSISALCKYTIIGICSTWQVLAPKMEKEKRTIVLESLCDFLGDVPNYPSKMDEEYDKLLVNVLTTLWKYAACSDVRVARSAFKALASYRLEQVPLKTLPPEFRCNLVLPLAYARTPADANRNPEDVLPYIPSTCWIQMLQKISRPVLSAVGDLLISHIKHEVSGFRSGIYTWQEEPRNFKYLPDKSVIRSIGEYLRKCDKTNPDNQYVIIECLRIFAYKFPKPLPNINWAFLEEISKTSKEAKEYSLIIACHHTPISPSARLFVENYLSKYKTADDFEPILQSNEYLILYTGLDDIVQTIQSNNLKLFLETTLDYVLEKIKIRDESAITAFANIMSSYGKALKNQEIHDGNSTLLSTILEKLLDQIDLTKDYFKPCIEATLELPIKHLERMTSPKVWWEIKPEKLKNAIAIRSQLALKRRAEVPLTLMNECIDVTTTIPSVQGYLLETMRIVQLEMQFDRSSTTWILNFMNEIQAALVESTEQDSNRIEFYCNILFISIICLSGVDCILTRKDVLITSSDVRKRLFVHGVATLAERQDWKRVVPQIMEWLHCMRQSSICEAYKSTFCIALICLRHNPFYKETWSKYLSEKTSFDPSIISNI